MKQAKCRGSQELTTPTPHARKAGHRGVRRRKSTSQDTEDNDGEEDVERGRERSRIQLIAKPHAPNHKQPGQRNAGHDGPQQGSRFPEGGHMRKKRERPHTHTEGADKANNVAMQLEATPTRTQQTRPITGGKYWGSIAECHMRNARKATIR